MNPTTLLETLCIDLWKNIDEYLFDPKLSSQSIKYLVTLQSLSELSDEMYPLTEILRSKRSDNIVDQHEVMHKKISLHNVYVVCKQCSCDGTLLKDKDDILCWKCMNNFDNKIRARCPLCCYDFSGDMNNCFWCGSNDTKLTKIEHWVHNELEKFLICERCIIADDSDGKNIRKALHPFLSIIK